MPIVGAIVLCQFDQFDRARIVRYANLNQAQRVSTPAEGGTGTLPKLKPGEKYWESVGGAYIYMTEGGRIVLASAFEDLIELDPDLNQVKSKSVNWQVVTAAGSQNMGVVRRWTLTGNNEVITDGIPAITFPTGTPLTEFVVSVQDKQNAITPVLKMTIGTVVDSTGIAISKLSTLAPLPTKQLAARITLSSGVQLDIDKEGRLSLKNVKMNINQGSVDATDPDVALGLEVNIPILGTKGQHAARQHDTVTIPCSIGYSDNENASLAAKSSANISFFTTLASAFMASGVACTFNPIPLMGKLKLEGEITTGAPNVIVGDS
jgi:hypothetical protein